MGSYQWISLYSQEAAKTCNNLEIHGLTQNYWRLDSYIRCISLQLSVWNFFRQYSAPVCATAERQLQLPKWVRNPSDKPTMDQSSLQNLKTTVYVMQIVNHIFFEWKPEWWEMQYLTLLSSSDYMNALKLKYWK